MVQGPGTLGPETAKNVWRAHKRDASPAASTTPGDVQAAGGLGQVPGHSPGDGPRASGGLTESGVRPARAAREEAQGDRKARGHPGTEKPAGRSQ